MSLPRFLNLSKFPEGGIILVIIVLGLLLSVFGGDVERPLIVNGQRVMHTVDGQQQPVFVKVNKFFNPETLTQIAKDTSFFAIMAVGMTIVIITAGIDLSVGAIYALAAVSGALFMTQFGSDGPGWAGLVGAGITIGVALLAGIANGIMITGLNVHPFIITLGTMAIYRGIAFVLTNGQSVGDFPRSLRDIVRLGARWKE